MYAQSTLIRVPLGYMEQMREMIRRDYFPILEERPGFVSALLLEQEDDPDRAEMLVIWQDQAAVERFNSTGMLEATIHALAAYLPEAQVQRQGYRLSVSAGKPLAEVEALPAVAV